MSCIMPSAFFSKCRIFTSAVIEGVQIVGPRMMLPISNLTSAAFLLVEETEVPRENHRGVIRKLRKTASAMIADLTHCQWDSNPRPQR